MSSGKWIFSYVRIHTFCILMFARFVPPYPFFFPNSANDDILYLKVKFEWKLADPLSSSKKSVEP
jgi:hypothetical protein